MTLYKCPECGTEVRIESDQLVDRPPIHECDESGSKMERVEEVVAITRDGFKHRFTVPGKVDEVKINA